MISPDLPLIDLHRHLDGSVRLTTILDVGQAYRLPLPAWTIEAMRPYVQVMEPQPGVLAFLERFRWMTGILVNESICTRVAYEAVEDCVREGLDYAELRFSPWFMSQAHGLDPAAVVSAVVEGCKQASERYDFPVGITGIISRTYGADVAMKELNALLTCRDELVALDLAGDEAHFPADWFTHVFKRARDAGWHITVHAGESAGAESIWSAIRDLGAERIGHAVEAVKDPGLLDYMATRNIGIEANLTSNVQTSTVPDYPSHPLKRFLEAGIRASINTDDPGISAIDLPYEYHVAAPKAGLSPYQIRIAQENALLTSFLPPDQQQRLREKKHETL